jgi:hypothetical protein
MHASTAQSAWVDDTSRAVEQAAGMIMSCWTAATCFYNTVMQSDAVL